jgi:hypothetical protein
VVLNLRDAGAVSPLLHDVLTPLSLCGYPRGREGGEWEHVRVGVDVWVSHIHMHRHVCFAVVS